MTTELFKMTEETTIQNGVETKEVLQIETIIKDDNDNEVGRQYNEQQNKN